MAECDAELYLRLAGERVLLGPGPEGGAPPESRLSTAAHALVAVGAIPAGTAQAIVDDYYLALSYRAGEHHHQRRSRRPAAATLGPLRAVPCQRVIEQPWRQCSSGMSCSAAR